MKWSETDRAALVIGYGNSLRRDDGAGLILGEAIVDAWRNDGLPVSLITAHQLSPELAEDIAASGAEIIIFVDAIDARRATGADPESSPVPSENAGMVHTCVQAVPIAADSFAGNISPSLGHHLKPATVLLYASRLYDFEGAGWLISVPGYDFDHGEGLSHTTSRLIEGFQQQVSELWKHVHQASHPGP